MTRARLVIGLCGSCRESIHHQQLEKSSIRAAEEMPVQTVITEERHTKMSKQKQQKSSNETVRVKVGKLSRQDKALMNAEAEDIRGGGGLSGGVLGDRGDQIIRKAGQ